MNEKGYEALIVFFETTLLLKERFNQNQWDFRLVMGKLKDYALQQTSVEELFSKLSIDYHRLILYHIDKPDIVRAANDIVIYADPHRKCFKNHFGPVKIAFAMETEAYNNGDKLNWSNVIGQFFQI